MPATRQLQSALDLLALGSPTAVTRSVAVFEAAARNGDAQGYCHLAALAAAGVGMPQDWSGALDFLLAGALGGSSSAQSQLALLAGESAAFDDWRALHHAVRLQDWMIPREKQVLRASPRTVAVRDFLSRATCDWLIGLARGHLAPARVYNRSDGTALEVSTRSNTAFELSFIDCDVVAHLTRARIAATIGVPVGALESSQILHYNVGETFALHHDYLDPADPGGRVDIAARGQRMVTFLAYLNDDFEGGATAFPALDLRHRGGVGDGLYFANIDSSGAPMPQTLHAGEAPTRGEKWVLSQWIRNRASV